MNRSETIMIFQKPELYFFPHYKNIVFPPYERREKTPLYYLYRCMNLLKLPCSSFFWGKWKSRIKSVNKVIIFDYGYQNCMEKYIKKANPMCEVYLFCWNKIDKYHNNNSKFTVKSNIYSTDRGDCDKYNLKYNHIFYPTELHKDWSPTLANNLYFIGADKGRAKKLYMLNLLFTGCGLNSNIRIVSNNAGQAYRDLFKDMLISKPISYTDYINEINKNGILLDINQEGQKAITMRVLESVVFSKKLITTNAEVKNFSFYNQNNILVIDSEKLPSPTDICEFISKPFIPYTDEQLYDISFEHWIEGFREKAPAKF